MRSTSETSGLALSLLMLLQEVYDNPDAAKAKGNLARRDIGGKFSNEAVSRIILKHLQHIQAKLDAPALSSSASEFGLQFQWYAVLHVIGSVCVEIADTWTEAYAAQPWFCLLSSAGP